MSLIQRFLLGNRVEDDLQVGLFLKNDGTVWLRNPDGSETQVGGGGGGGLPDWWIVDDAAQTVTVEFADDPDGDYTGLTIEALGAFDGYTGIEVLGVSQSISLKYTSPDMAIVVADGGKTSQIGPGYGLFEQAGGDDNPALLVHHTNPDRVNDLVQVYQTIGSGMLWGVTKAGLEYKQNNDFTEPDDGDVLPNQILEWYDSTENAIAARFKAQDSAGNPFAGKVATMLPDGSAFQGVALPLLAATPTVAQISTVLAGLGLTRQT